MRRGVIIALLLACGAGAGGGIWSSIATTEGTRETADTGAVTPGVTVSGMAETRLAAAISSASQRSGIAKYAVTVERQETRKVTSNSGRKVAEVLVKVGDEVEEGMALMRYDDENDEMTIQSYEYDIEKAKLDIETKTMNIQKAEAELSKLKDLELEERKIQIAQTRNQIAQDEYNIGIREKNIEALREMTSEKEVKSRYVGIVTKIQKGNGSSDNDSSDDDTEVTQYTITIAESQNLLLKGTAGDAAMTNIFQGQSVVAYSRVNPDIYWYGIISKVQKPGEGKDDSDSGDDTNSGGSSGSGNYTYYVELESEDGLLVGQHLYMEPDLGQTGREGGLWIDESFLLAEGGQNFVWVENDQGRIEKRAVTASRPDEYGKVQIMEGLGRLEYIAENNGLVKEGMRCRHADEAAAASGQGKNSSAGFGYGEEGSADSIGEPDFAFSDDDFEFGENFLDMDDGGMDDGGWDDGDWDDGDWDDGDWDDGDFDE